MTFQMLNVFLSGFAQDPNLVKNYIIITLLTLFAGNLFYYCFWKRDYEGMENKYLNIKSGLKSYSLDTHVSEEIVRVDLDER